MAELTQVESHFRFGENWAAFARHIEEPRIAQAQRDLVRLLGRERLDGLTFLDIGSGSGLHSLAALRLGAKVTAIDIDADSVATTRALLTRLAPSGDWSAESRSVFDLRPEFFGRYDIVYSWGVLHHTGAMFEAIRRAAALVAGGGSFCVALYRRTSLCAFWRLEKRFYSHAPAWLQRVVQSIYIGTYWVARSVLAACSGRRFSLREHADNYLQNRGMNFYTDAHDWLGGYPYESVSPAQLRSFMRDLGFAEERSFVRAVRGRLPLIFGCDEYLFARNSAGLPG